MKGTIEKKQGKFFANDKPLIFFPLQRVFFKLS